MIADVGANLPRPQRAAYAIPVTTYNQQLLHLAGLRLLNAGNQPLILWPGFFQNGFVYDLLPDGGSLGEYLWRQGFDIWIIHPRGTGDSGGRWRAADLDDFAAADIPTVVEYVIADTGRKPIYVGHSQGGIAAMMSLMGACKQPDGAVALSDEHARTRQSQLQGLVTLGSFPEFTFSKASWLQDFVQKGIVVKIFGHAFRLIRPEPILRLLRPCQYLPIPVGLKLRRALFTKTWAQILLLPLYLILNFSARLALWEFLYHLPNVSDAARRALFYKTQDGTYWGILHQFHQAVMEGQMWSRRHEVNYSASYHRLALPVSLVAMELDTLADPAMMKNSIYERIASKKKSYAEWKQMGHEDHFMNPAYFPLVLAAITKVCTDKKPPMD